MYRNAERYGDNLKTFYVGNTNIMKEDEKRKILKKYYENFEPIDLVKDIYTENEGLDPLSKMSDVDIHDLRIVAKAGAMLNAANNTAIILRFIISFTSSSTSSVLRLSLFVRLFNISITFSTVFNSLWFIASSLQKVLTATILQGCLHG